MIKQNPTNLIIIFLYHNPAVVQLEIFIDKPIIPAGHLQTLCCMANNYMFWFNYGSNKRFFSNFA